MAQETLPALLYLLALCEGNPSITSGFSTQRTNNAEFWCCCQSYQSVEQTVELPMIWDAMWHHCYGMKHSTYWHYYYGTRGSLRKSCVGVTTIISRYVEVVQNLRRTWRIIPTRKFQWDFPENCVVCYDFSYLHVNKTYWARIGPIHRLPTGNVIFLVKLSHAMGSSGQNMNFLSQPESRCDTFLDIFL